MKNRNRNRFLRRQAETLPNRSYSEIASVGYRHLCRDTPDISLFMQLIPFFELVLFIFDGIRIHRGVHFLSVFIEFPQQIRNFHLYVIKHFILVLIKGNKRFTFFFNLLF